MKRETIWLLWKITHSIVCKKVMMVLTIGDQLLPISLVLVAPCQLAHLLLICKTHQEQLIEIL